MFKLLRQYNKWILAVGGTLLLITFLMPTAIQSCAEQSAFSGSTWATYDGGSVTGAELELAQKELRVVEVLRNPQFAQLGADRDPAHWWLLVHEATKAGLVGGAGEGEAMLAQIAAGAGNGAEPNRILFNIAQASGTNADVVLVTLAKAQGVQRLLSLATNIDRVSDLRLEQEVAKSMLGITGDLVVIDARTNSTISVTTPTEAALEAQLKAWADKPAPAVGQQGLENFGYRVPDRFKLEWITIPKASVEALVDADPELTTIALKKRFAQDPAKYGADPAMNPAFAAYEATVRSRTRQELVDRRLEEIAKAAGDQLGLAQRSLEREGVYFKLPADWASQMPAFATVAEALAKDFGIALPSYQSSGEAWLEVEDIATLPGVGTARTERFGTPVRTQQLVAGAKELSAPSVAAPFQLGIASPALKGDNGDVHFVRLLEASASAPAIDLADARAEVERDVLAVERFRALEAELGAIRDQAIAEGPRAVADKYGAKVEFVKDLREANPQFVQFGIRIGTAIPGLGTDPKALDAIVDQASRLPLTADIATLPAAERTFAIAAPDKLSILVLQVTGLAPVTIEEYKRLSESPTLAGVVRDPALVIDPAKIFSYEALAARWGFKSPREDEARAEEAAAASQG
ncbi:MAG: hypothetical protein RI967_2672 [Planctomycetota bacterium]